MIRHLLLLFTSLCAISYVHSVGEDVLRDISNLIPPCTTSELRERIPRNADVIVYFHDRYPDGSYVFGYILSSGERRYERGTRYSGYLFVDGFYSYRKFANSRYVYETTRYTAGKEGYYPSRVEVTYEPPKVPTVDYFKGATEEDRVEESSATEEDRVKELSVQEADRGKELSATEEGLVKELSEPENKQSEPKTDILSVLKNYLNK